MAVVEDELHRIAADLADVGDGHGLLAHLELGGRGECPRTSADGE
jgi:hypothetical protein